MESQPKKYPFFPPSTLQQTHQYDADNTQQHTPSVCCDPTTQQQAHPASYDPTALTSTTITILFWHSNHSTTTAMLLWTNLSATTRITVAYGYNTQQQKYSYRSQSIKLLPATTFIIRPKALLPR